MGAKRAILYYGVEYFISLHTQPWLVCIAEADKVVCIRHYHVLQTLASKFSSQVRLYVLVVIGARVVRHYDPLPTEVAVMARS